MELTFLEWRLVYEALRHESDRLEGNIKWREDYAREKGIETVEPDLIILHENLDTVTGIMQKLGNATL